nr:tetratricopeptide repeat protein [Candidatus Sigynarchaeota archaeon]
MVTWLHISDLHFREADNTTMRPALKLLLKNLTEQHREGLNLDFIVITGDIAFSGKREEYEIARCFLDELLVETGVKKEKLFIVPGNHDVDRSKIISSTTTDWKSVKDVDVFFMYPRDVITHHYLLELQGFRDFYNNYFRGIREYDDYNHYSSDILDLGDVRVILVGLSSLWNSNKDDRKGSIIITERQVLKAIETARKRLDNLEKESKKDVLKICFCHHPLSWLKDFDANSIEPHLFAEFNFFLTGHIHGSIFDQIQRKDGKVLFQISAGSTFVRYSDEGKQTFNITSHDTRTGKGVFNCWSFEKQLLEWCRDSSVRSIMSRDEKAGEHRFSYPSKKRNEKAGERRFSYPSKKSTIEEEISLYLSTRGNQCMDQGDYQKAIDFFDEVLKLVHFDITTLISKGEVLTNLGKHEDAIACFDSVLIKDSDNVDALFDKGIALCPLGKHEDAIACYDRVLAEDPGDDAALINKGIELGELGKHEDAIACYDLALAKDPENFHATFNKGVAFSELGKYEEAIVYFEHVLTKDPENFKALINKGNALGELGKYLDAIAYYEHVLTKDPGNADALLNKGIALCKLGKHEDAITCYDCILAKDPGNFNALVNKGIELGELGKHDDAFACFDSVLAKDPGNADALVNKGNALSEVGKHEDAITCFDSVLVKDPGDTDLLIKKGVELGELGKHEDAIACFDSVLVKDPENFHTLFHKGVTLSELGRYEEVIGCSDQVLTKDPENFNALFNKGNALSNLGKHDDAIACYEHVLAKDPENFHALVDKGIVFEKTRKYNLAYECFKKALSREPEDVSLLNNISVLSLIDGSFDKAREQLEKVLEMNILPEKKMITRFLYIIFLFITKNHEEVKSNVILLTDTLTTLEKSGAPLKVDWDFDDIKPVIQTRLDDNGQQVIRSIIHLLLGEKSVDDFKKQYTGEYY